MLKNNIRAKDILTYDAFKNAIAIMYAVGGSTNAVLHILAIAYEVGIKLQI